MEVTWNPDKNATLQRDRGISFEEIVAVIEAGGLVANQPHPNRDQYPHQRVLIVAIHNYAYVVPCVVTGEVYELITLFPSRKATRDYIRRHTP
ncbi:MAG: BrnT family toxin [Candidatus Tectomicrobia bacterium]|nr:BrnT family toxin [Candidatus Tectomicrobia bacterium]